MNGRRARGLARVCRMGRNFRALVIWGAGSPTLHARACVQIYAHDLPTHCMPDDMHLMHAVPGLVRWVRSCW